MIYAQTITYGICFLNKYYTQNRKIMKEKIVLKNEGNRLNVIGDHQQIKLSGKDTNEQYVFIVQDNPPGTQLPPHIHEKEDEVYNILEGEVEFTADGKTSFKKW